MSQEILQEVLGEIKSVNTRLDGMEQRFDGIDQRLDGMDQRFDDIDQRLDGMDQRLDGMDQRFDRIDQRLDGIDQRFDGMEERLDAVYNQTANLLEFRVEVNTKLDNIGDKIKDIEAVTKQNTYDIARLKSLR